jgi:replication factor A2
VTDFNEISYHLLEATATHLYFTRGPPGSLGGGIKAEGGDSMFVDSYGSGGPAAGAVSGRKISSKIGATGRKVFELLQSAPQNNEGLHVHNIAQQLGIGVNDVFKAGDELLGEGMIYTTIDDETWAVLEY